MKNKEKAVTVLTKGIEFLFKKNKVSYFKGKGSFKSSNEIVVSGDGKETVIETQKAIISTGSEPVSIPGMEFDEEKIISSTGALSLEKLPKKMVVVGGGYIGLEMGSVWSRLGTDVEVVEFLDHITPGMDREISTEFMKILKKQGIKFKLNTKVEKITKNENGVTLDVIDGPMLAHKAEEEGIAVAEFIAGQSGHVNYEIIPGVIYTSPEVASVGKTEEQLNDKKINFKVGKFPFMANSRAKAIDEPEGFVKILADATSDKVLGVHIIGPHAGEMIAEMAIAMEFGASSEDIARTCHAHPTFSEAIKEAALSVEKRQIHS